MAPCTKSNTFTQNRSISFPCRSHPTTLRIQNELTKLKTWEEEEEEEASSSTSAAERICNGLSGLEELYKCVDDLYHLPLTKQALNEKWAHDELLDGSVSLLDICGFGRDYMSQMKEHVTDVQSALRRRNTTSIETSIVRFNCLRKKMKKDARKLIATMKKMDSKINEGSPVFDISVIRVLKEVNGVSISIFRSLLMLLAVPVSKSKTSKWSVVSRLLHRGAVGCEDQQDNMSVLERVDIALESLLKNGVSEGDRVQLAQDSLEALEETIKMIENHLECMFRGLVRARASLLNIASH